MISPSRGHVLATPEEFCLGDSFRSALRLFNFIWKLLFKTWKSRDFYKRMLTFSLCLRKECVTGMKRHIYCILALELEGQRFVLYTYTKVTVASYSPALRGKKLFWRKNVVFPVRYFISVAVLGRAQTFAPFQSKFLGLET